MALNTIPPIRAVYAISCGQRHYVGGSSNVHRRWMKHRAELRGGYHKNAKLSAAWTAKGEGAFTFTTLETVFDQVDLLDREQYWIDRLRAAKDGFNVAPTAGNSTGCVTSPETAAKISRSLSGRSLTEEHKARISKSLDAWSEAKRAREARAERRANPKPRTPKVKAEPRAPSGRGSKVLTDADVLAIRARVAAGEAVQSVAKAFSTTKGNISLIYHRKRRASVS